MQASCEVGLWRMRGAAVTCLALMLTLCGCVPAVGPSSASNATDAAAAEMSVAVGSATGDIAWGAELSAAVSGAPEGAELAYDWQVSTDGGETWGSYGSADEAGKQKSLAMLREWTGTCWRCVVTASVGGEEVAKAASGVVGPIEAQHTKVAGTVHHPEPLRVGKTLSVELELPEGTSALVRWMRASSYDGDYEYIDGATDDKYTLTESDLGCYIACRVDASAVGYIFEGDTETIAMPVLAARGSETGSGSGSVVYVCDSAGESWYHCYDCDELSRLRQLGYSTREVSLEEAKTYCSPCPYCMG